MLRALGRMGRSKPESSLRGELVPDGARELIVGLVGGSRGPSSSMRLKRSVVTELALERVGRRIMPPFTGLDVPERLPASVG